MRPAPPPVRVLATGFGPFPGIPYNVSATLVQALAQSRLQPGIELSTEVIPVLWDEARAASLAAIAKHKPHAILHFGVAKRAVGFEIEARAFNLSNAKEDQARIVRAQVALVRSGLPVLPSTLPVYSLIQALKRGGYPALLSRDAGRYLCNAVLYWSLMSASLGKERPLTAFIHVPALGTATGVEARLTMEEMVRGAGLLVRASAEAVLREALKTGGGKGRGNNGHGSKAVYWSRRGGRRVIWNHAG